MISYTAMVGTAVIALMGTVAAQDVSTEADVTATLTIAEGISIDPIPNFVFSNLTTVGSDSVAFPGQDITGTTSFVLHGDNNAQYLVSFAHSGVATNELTLSSNSTHRTIELPITVDGSSSNLFFDDGGTASVMLTAQATIAADQPPGVYSGTFQVVVAYP